jgi:AcrR family transcriptional regulator
VKSARPRDAAASKQALLGAAQSLFGQRGFEGTTIRDIGECAGVDAALIARYFGSKADLYIAAVVAEAQGDQPPHDFEGLADITDAVVTRTDRDGLGPVTQALIRPDIPADIRQAARAHLLRRIVAPLEADMARKGIDRPRLRAEIVTSALLGLNLGRALGWFAELQAVSKDELVELATTLLDGERRRR